MENITHRLSLFGLGILVISLAAALTLGFIELLSHVDLGRLGAGASTLPTVDGHSTQAALMNALGVFEVLAHWLVALAAVAGVLVLPMAALVLLGMGGVCVYGSVAGLPKPSLETADDAEPVFGLSSLLRKLNPPSLS